MAKGAFKSGQNKTSRKVISQFLIPIFISNLCVFATPAKAQNPSPASEQSLSNFLPNLPKPGEMVTFSSAYQPMVLMGVTVNPDNPLRFNFIIDKGDSKLEGAAFEQEAQRLIKYFLAALTIPDDEVWVNLSPYEKDLMIPAVLGVTEMGKNLLSEDYVLKQVTSSLTHPEETLGKKFWERVYKEAFKKFGTTDLPYNTFSKVWIVPAKAGIAEQNGTAFVTESKLKVLSEEDYLAVKKNLNNKEIGTDLIEEDQVNAINKMSAQIMTEVILPEIEKEINVGKNFASVRQVYNSVILATWFKQSLKDSLLSQVYVDKNKVAGVNVDDSQAKEKIYNQYLEALQKGSYNIEKEDFDEASNMIYTRRYFSGGAQLGINKQEISNIYAPIEQAVMNNVIPTGEIRAAFVQSPLFKTDQERTQFASQYQAAEVQGPAAVRNYVRQFTDSLRPDQVNDLRVVSRSLLPTAQEVQSNPRQVADRIVGRLSTERLEIAVNDKLTGADRVRALDSIRTIQSATEADRQDPNFMKNNLAPIRELISTNAGFAKSVADSIPTQPAPIMALTSGAEARPAITRVQSYAVENPGRVVTVSTDLAANKVTLDRTQQDQIDRSTVAQVERLDVNPRSAAVVTLASADTKTVEAIASQLARGEERSKVTTQILELQQQVRANPAVLDNPATLIKPETELGKILSRASAGTDVLRAASQSGVTPKETRQAATGLVSMPKEVQARILESADISDTELPPLQTKIVEISIAPVEDRGDMVARELATPNSPVAKMLSSNQVRSNVLTEIRRVEAAVVDVDLAVVEQATPAIRQAVVGNRDSGERFLTRVSEASRPEIKGQLERASADYSQTGDVGVTLAKPEFRSLNAAIDSQVREMTLPQRESVIAPVMTAPALSTPMVLPTLLTLSRLTPEARKDVYRQNGIDVKQDSARFTQLEAQVSQVASFDKATANQGLSEVDLATRFEAEVKPQIRALNNFVQPNLDAINNRLPMTRLPSSNDTERAQLALVNNTDGTFDRLQESNPEAAAALKPIREAVKADPKLASDMPALGARFQQQYQESGGAELTKAVGEVAVTQSRVANARMELVHLVPAQEQMNTAMEANPDSQLSQGWQQVTKGLAELKTSDRSSPAVVNQVFEKAEAQFPEFKAAVAERAANLPSAPAREVRGNIELASQVAAQAPEATEATLQPILAKATPDQLQAIRTQLTDYRVVAAGLNPSGQYSVMQQPQYQQLARAVQETVAQQGGIERMTPRLPTPVPIASARTQTDNVGGIDLSAGMMNLMVQSDGTRMVVPISKEMIEKLNIDGLTPEIINISPVDTTNFPGLSAVSQPSGREQYSALR